MHSVGVMARIWTQINCLRFCSLQGHQLCALSFPSFVLPSGLGNNLVSFQDLSLYCGVSQLRVRSGSRMKQTFPSNRIWGRVVEF